MLAFERSGGLLELAAETDAQLEIFQGDNAASATAPNLLIFAPVGSAPWWQTLGEEIEVAAPQIKVSDHPVIRHLEVDSLPFVGARRLTLPAGAQVLVAAEDDTPLIYRVSHAGQNAIVVNFDPLVSEFYFSTYFPALVYDTAVHLLGRAEKVESTYATGRRAVIPGIEAGEESTVIAPDEIKSTVSTNSIGPLQQPGFYQFENRGGDWLAGCSVLSTVETLIENKSIEDTSQSINRGNSPSHWLMILAIVTLVIESVLYHRRKVG